MNKFGVDQLTLRDLDAMSRPALLESLQQIAAFFPMDLNHNALARMSDGDLRQLLARARRKFQGLGY